MGFATPSDQLVGVLGSPWQGGGLSFKPIHRIDPYRGRRLKDGNMLCLTTVVVRAEQTTEWCH